MKKGIYLFCLALMFHICIFEVDAGNAVVQDGYTNEGIYYQIFEWDEDINICAIGDTRNVSICIEFSDKVIPPKKQVYTCKYAGKTYSGELNLQYVRYRDDWTYAYYAGVVTLQE